MKRQSRLTILRLTFRDISQIAARGNTAVPDAFRSSAGRSATAIGLVLAGTVMITTGARALPTNVNGDVFVGVGNGQVFQYTQTGTLVQKLQSPNTGTEDTGMAFDSSGTLYSTNFESNQIVTYNTNGIATGTFGSGFNSHPESILFDSSGNAYVGQADGTHDILKFSSTGALLKTIVPGLTDRGTDWIDLAADEQTLFYAGEGAHIRTVNAVSGVTGTFTSSGLGLFAMRILPNGDVLAADTSNVLEFDSLGNIIKTYTGFTGASELFALNLDPDGTSFWTGDIGGSTGVWKVDIASGNILEHWDASKDGATEVAGLAVFGELTVSNPPPTTTPEPGTLSLLGSGLAAMGLWARRRRR
jgi:hypothetical protein